MPDAYVLRKRFLMHFFLDVNQHYHSVHLPQDLLAHRAE